jgi:CubicO group peptidase (beta-lactamase class C family)
MTRKILLAAGVALIAASPSLAVEEGFAERAQALVDAAYPDDKPGAAVVVTEGGKVIYAGGSGAANVERGVPITADTVFRLGSITKQFAAAALLKLVAEGKLSLDDPLSKFLPDYPAPGSTATVRQLLNHTSGIQSYTGIPGWMNENKTARTYTTAELIAEFSGEPVEFQPGERWNYNNSGYVLVGAVIEAVTGKPWHEVVREKFAVPLGLSTIRYGGDEATTPGFATGYTDNGDGTFMVAQKIDMSVPHAAGGLIGTVGDLARWNQALHHGKVVPETLYREMITPTALPGGKSEPYGYGIGLSDVRGTPAIGHSGGIFGFSTNSIYVPERDLFVAVFVNSDSGVPSSGTAMMRLAAEAIGKPFPVMAEVAFDPASIEDAYGVYRIEGGEATRAFYRRDGQLFTRREGGQESRIYFAGDNRFFYGADSLTWFELVRGDDGYAMLMHHDGVDQAERAVRTGPIPAEAATVAVDPQVLASYVGSYTSPIAPIVVALADGGALTLKFAAQPATPLRAIGEADFTAVGVDATVNFRTEGGKVTGLVIRQGGRDLPASRDPAQ